MSGRLGDEFLAEVAGVTGFLNGLDDGGIIQLLRLIDLGTTGNAASVVVGEGFVMLDTVPAFQNGADLHSVVAFDGGKADHRAMQAVFLHRGKVLRVEQLDGFEADVLRGEGHVLTLARVPN